MGVKQIYAHFPNYKSHTNPGPGPVNPMEWGSINPDLGPWIETFTGKKFHFLNPQPDEICIEDIAHALSNTCRFTGHCSFFYSVAEHSISVAKLTDSLEGLLHDASEAYITDISSPLKPLLSNYRDIERRITKAIERQFNLRTEPEIHKQVKQIDLLQLSIEAEYLIKSKGKDWDFWQENGGRPIGQGIKPVGYRPLESEWRFLKCFYEIKNNAPVSH